MRDLRLIGVHDDGEHLVVTDDNTGEEFRLRIDEQLRAAARRDRPRLGQLQIAIDNDVRPREVQAMVRAGATAEEVAARTGWDLEKVARFEGPVLAEREHVARRAQTVRMRGTNQAGAPETLTQRAATRFHGRGVDPASVKWDAYRDAEGQWTVSATFTAGGRERSATWWFDQAGMSVVAKNDEAKWLSEADAPAGPVPAAVHRPTAVFDVEVEETKVERATRANTDELIASMREHSGAKSRRRGSRRRARGADTPAPDTDDALPLEEQDGPPPAARGPHPKDVAADEQTEAKKTPGKAGSKAKGSTAGKQPASSPPASDEAQPARESAPGERQEESTRDASGEAAPTAAGTTAPPVHETSAAPDVEAQEAPETSAHPPAGGGGTSESAEVEERTGREGAEDTTATEDASGDTTGKGRGRKGRASVPSWDDVMFGTRRD